MYQYDPDPVLRTAYIAALSNFIEGVPIYVDLVPKSAGTPLLYILITSQTTVRTNVSKPTNLSDPSDNFGWLSSIVFDVQNVSQAGFSNPGPVDYVIGQIVNVAENLMIDGWAVKSRVFVQSRPLNVATATNFINRKVLTYQHWLEKIV